MFRLVFFLLFIFNTMCTATAMITKAEAPISKGSIGRCLSSLAVVADIGGFMLLADGDDECCSLSFI
jgi:hypothetical protein